MEKFKSWTCSANLLPGDPDHPTGPTETSIEISCDGLLDLDEAKALLDWLKCAVREMEQEK